jgi:hypothetical protein
MRRGGKKYKVSTEEFKKWITEKNNDLIYGAYIIAKYHYPDITFKELDNNLDSLIIFSLMTLAGFSRCQSSGFLGGMITCPPEKYWNGC